MKNNMYKTCLVEVTLCNKNNELCVITWHGVHICPVTIEEMAESARKYALRNCKSLRKEDKIYVKELTFKFAYN